MKTIKLIWDFRGKDALPTAKHHEIHLVTFINRENLTLNTTGYQALSPLHAIAFMHVTEAQMILVRDALKPHRGEYVEK